jgi:acyl-CoA synthetase (AMP-forming)/AMP-acid ligase II
MTVEDQLSEAFGDLPTLIAAHAQARPDSIAVIDGDRTATYRELNTLMDRVAAGLQRDGVKPTDAIAVCAYASLEYVATFLGGLRAGVAVSPLAPSSTPEQLIMMLDDCAAPLFFLDDGVAALMAPVAERISARTHGPSPSSSSPTGPSTSSIRQARSARPRASSRVTPCAGPRSRGARVPAMRRTQ